MTTSNHVESATATLVRITYRRRNRRSDRIHICNLSARNRSHKNKSFENTPHAITATSLGDESVAFTAELPMLFLGQLEQQPRMVVSRALSKVSGFFANGASDFATRETQSNAHDDSIGWYEASTRRICTVSSVGSIELDGPFRKSSQQLGRDDGAHRG